MIKNAYQKLFSNNKNWYLFHYWVSIYWLFYNHFWVSGRVVCSSDSFSDVLIPYASLFRRFKRRPTNHSTMLHVSTPNNHSDKDDGCKSLPNIYWLNIDLVDWSENFNIILRNISSQNYFLSTRALDLFRMSSHNAKTV